MKTKLNSITKKVYSDQITPIGAYLNVRGLFPCSFLLESSEIDDKRNSHSIICANPIAGIEVKKDKITTFLNNVNEVKIISDHIKITEELKIFFSSFDIEEVEITQKGTKPEGINGFFGFQSFEAVRFFESKKANLCQNTDEEVALIDYRLFKYVICFNHFNGEVVFVENTIPGETSELDNFIDKVLNTRSGTYSFSLKSEEEANISEQQFLRNVEIAQQHCQRGDVFQMVLSRKFKRKFAGDEFNVYRALRHINPSPYMFFFDYGSYKIFGSSPEAQIRVSNNEAQVNPIAGTYKRTGFKEQDAVLAESLLNDKKESAEHAMLVDLARNDLNRHCSDVKVSEYKSIKQYSHVIHMVSTVTGKLDSNSNTLDVLADTFPAGTLSGAPKVKAIQLLAEIENDPRGFYGGSIGFINFNGDIKQAIIIRSFLTKKDEIYFRAGAGIVLKSNPNDELQEVSNKLSALRLALVEAEYF